MECRKVLRKLSAYMDKELSDAESAALAVHLKNCEDCRKELGLLAGQDRFIASAAGIEPSAGFNARVWRKIDSAVKETYIPVLRWLPVPAACVILIIAFLSFSIVSPLVYSQDKNLNMELKALALKTIIPTTLSNIFAPVALVNFCNEYCRIMCSHCDGTKCGDCSNM